MKYILIILWCLLPAISIFAKKKQPVVVQVDSTQIVLTQTRGAAIAPFGDTLFLIHGNIGSFTVVQRALAIQDKIKELEEYPFFEEDSLKLIIFSDHVNLEYNDPAYSDAKIIVSVDTLQAQIYGKSKFDLANQYRAIIIKTISERNNQGYLKKTAINTGIALLIIAGVAFFIKLVQWCYRRVKILVRIERNKKINGVLGIIDAEKEEQIIFVIIKFLRFLIIGTVLFISIILLLKLFPHTINLSDQLLEYVVSPLKKITLGIIDYLPKLFTIIFIIAIFIYVRKFLASITQKISEGKITFKGFYPDWAKPTYNIVSAVLFVFMFILIFPYLPNSNSQVFQGVSVFVGVIISLGSTNVIGNLIAGLVITYMRPFRTGDRVKMDETIGNVIEKTALVTRIKTAKNEVLTIPNSSVMNTKTINYTFSANQYGLILFITVTVGYDEPWRKVHDLLLKAAYKTDNLSARQKPFIMQTAFDDFYVEYQLNVFTRDANKMNDIYSDLRKNVQDVFKDAEIEILSPHYRINKNIYDFDNPHQKDPYTESDPPIK